MADFAAKLKELREKAGLTQEELGTRAGIHKLTVAKYEQGLREPTWAVAMAICDALGVSCETLREPPSLPQGEKAGPGRPPNKAGTTDQESGSSASTGKRA